MIIDQIIDRKDGMPYAPKALYDYVSREQAVGFYIAQALDSGEEADVRKALCAYVDEQDYNPGIKDYINSVNWL